MPKKKNLPSALNGVSPAPVSTPAVSAPPKSSSANGLTGDLLERIETKARVGLKDAQIYALLKIPQPTWSTWLNNADSGLAMAIARARAELAENLLTHIQTLPKGWQAGVWLLTQHFPGDYTRPAQDNKVTHSGEINGTITHVSEEELAKTQVARRRYLEEFAAAVQAHAPSDDAAGAN